MSNLAVRSLVAAVGIPLILAASLFGGFFFFILIAAISAGALHEFYVLAKSRGASPQVGTGLLFGFCLNLVFMHQVAGLLLAGVLAGLDVIIHLPTFTQAFLVTVLLFVSITLLVELFRNKAAPLLNIATTVLGVAYVAVFLGCLIGLREIFVPAEFPVHRHFQVLGLDISQELVNTIDRWGGWTVTALFVSLWVCDSAAYFAGFAFGKHKLFPRISPQKTWEGATAGFLGAVGMFVLAKWLLLPYLSFTEAVVCGGIVGVFGQLGDLVESMMKRDSGVKDSSGLIPGHGGVLDRFDSLILVSPILFLYFDFVVFAS